MTCTKMYNIANIFYSTSMCIHREMCSWDTDAPAQANRKQTYDGLEKGRHNTTNSVNTS